MSVASPFHSLEAGASGSRYQAGALVTRACESTLITHPQGATLCAISAARRAAEMALSNLV